MKKIALVILFLVLSLSLTGCYRNTNFEEYFRLMKDDFEKNYSLSISDKNKMSDQEYNLRLFSEQLSAGINDEKEREQWQEFQTYINYISTDRMSPDLLAEKTIVFINKDNYENKIILNEIYYADDLEWIPLKSKSYTINGDTTKQLENNTLWNCDFDAVIEECSER